jgi:hypothetical protein
MWPHSIGDTEKIEAGALSLGPEFRLIKKDQKEDSGLSIALSIPRCKGLLEPISDPEHFTGMATPTGSAEPVITGS